MSSGAGVMGRPKKADRKPPPPDDRVAIIHLKGTGAYSEWLDVLHRKSHIAKATLFRLALAEWAERNGYPSPPEI